MHLVKEFMGHAHITTTGQFYTKVTTDHADYGRWFMEQVMVGEADETNARLTPECGITSNRRAG